MALVALAVAWLAGIAYAALGGSSPELLSASVGSGAVAFGALRRSVRVVMLGLACGAVVGMGACRYQDARWEPRANSVARFNDGRPVALRAVVIDEPVERGGAQRVRVEAREVLGFGGWRKVSGRILVRAPLHPRLAYGDRVQLTGTLETPPRLPDFDYRTYLLRQGVVSLMDYPRIERHGGGGANPLMARVVAIRDALSLGIERTLPEPEAALAEGFLLGRRAALPPGLTSAFNVTGTAHLIAISGYNVSLVAALVTSALAWGIGRRQASLVALVVIGAYAVLTGGSPPVVRAAVMGGMYVMAGLLGRPASAGPAVAAAAAGMTGAEPAVIHDVSFQLSFAAVAGMAWLATPLERYLWAVWSRAWPPWLAVRALVVEPAAVTAAAIIATAPIVAWHFDRFSLVALPANLVALPLVPLTLASSLLAALIGLTGLDSAPVVLVAWAPLRAMTFVVELFARVPAAAVGVPGFGFWHMVAVLAAAVAAAWRLSSSIPTTAVDERVGLGALLSQVVVRWLRPSPTPWMSAGMALGALAWGAASFVPGDGPRLRITVLDVGQGDAILVETPSGTQALIDGGPDGTVLRELGRVMGPFDRDLDLLILTHPQSDHQIGLIEVLERYQVRFVVLGPARRAGAVETAWRDALRREGAEVMTLTAPASVDLGDGVSLDLLWPDGRDTARAPNNESLVFRLRYGNVTTLLVADIEAEAEAALLAAGFGLRADVLKVAHHGSKTSTTQPFVDAVRPDVAVISVGRANRFGHPSASVVERLEASGADVYRTDSHGRIVITTDGRRLWVR